jgi:hypothetical protein
MPPGRGLASLQTVIANFRKVYSVVGALLLLEFFTQFYAIAAAMFTTVAKEIADGQNGVVTQRPVHDVEFFAGVHAVTGTFIMPATLLILIALSIGARYPWRTTGLTVVLFLLLVVQFLLAFVGFMGGAAVAGLHGINALLMVGLGLYLVTRNWAFRHQAAVAPPS